MNKVNKNNDKIYLFQYNDKINFFLNLFKKNKFPKVSLLSGRKGIGKFTLILFFLNYIFNKKKKKF